MTKASRKRILVTGPTRSGKSEWAEWLALQSQQSVTYVATAQIYPDDLEWQARIATHRQRRSTSWQTLEVPIALADALHDAPLDQCWLVDSLGSWLANCLELSEAVWAESVEALLSAIADFPGTLILVAEETGWGLVPAYPTGRLFRDRLGELTRRIGAIADATYLVVAGRAIDIQQIGTPVSCFSPPEGYSSPAAACRRDLANQKGNNTRGTQAAGSGIETAGSASGESETSQETNCSNSS